MQTGTYDRSRLRLQLQHRAEKAPCAGAQEAYVHAVLMRKAEDVMKAVGWGGRFGSRGVGKYAKGSTRRCSPFAGDSYRRSTTYVLGRRRQDAGQQAVDGEARVVGATANVVGNLSIGPRCGA